MKTKITSPFFAPSNQGVTEVRAEVHMVFIMCCSVALWGKARLLSMLSGKACFPHLHLCACTSRAALSKKEQLPLSAPNVKVK